MNNKMDKIIILLPFVLLLIAITIRQIFKDDDREKEIY